MQTTLSEIEKRERLMDILKDFDTAMLVTKDSSGGLHARPMSIADKRDDGTLYFSTAVHSKITSEIDANPNVTVTIQGKNRFVSLTGSARLLQKQSVIDALWSESWRVWFPKGRNDPALCIIAVDPIEAQYWDMGGAEGLRYLFKAVKAYALGTGPAFGKDERHSANVKL